MRNFKCSICGYVYDESAGIPDKGIAPGTKWEEIPDDFQCPICTALKSVFSVLGEGEPSTIPDVNISNDHVENLKELSPGEISAICSLRAVRCANYLKQCSKTPRRISQRMR